MPAYRRVTARGRSGVSLMPVQDPGIRLSQIDTDRFGVITARADGLDLEQLESAIGFCDSHKVQLLISRCRVEDAATTHALSAAGFLLMDTLVYYQRDLARSPVTGQPSGPIELMRPGDDDQVEAIARECFRNYSGHYHADPRLDRDACTETYASWARACCEQADGGFVLVAGPTGRRVGFASFHHGPKNVGELVLGAVLPAAQGGGLYRNLTLAGMLRLQSSGAQKFITSTQLTNWSAQASWTAAGLHPYSAYHTFHRWFDSP
jgi:ribosomal protein S18 acetylase RimI-like enzyme